MAEPVFEDVLRDHGRALFRAAQGYAATAADADDLYQEICLAVWRALPRFRGEASLGTWLWRIAHNRGLTFRARSARPQAVELPDHLADASPLPDEALLRSLGRDELLAAIHQLSDAQCEVMLLSLEGLSYAEMAEVLGTSPNAVAVRLNRAKRNLQALLSRKDDL